MATGSETDHVYKVIELVGTSDKSVDDAIKSGIARANATLKHLRWFEVVQVRGHIEDGHVGHYQVTMKVGFTLE
ncbi:MAG TPA: dodecin [Alphaproteobacteria bacterium]|nr:dodecin [Alphaproteobacteria bacterium]